MIKFTVELTGAAQVPPVDCAATGTVEVTHDTEANTLAWVVTTEGLSGATTASHIHGPAAATEPAGPVIDTLAAMEGNAPITGEQTNRRTDEQTNRRTDEQIADPNGGMYY